jgi:hypothetical protein
MGILIGKSDATLTNFEVTGQNVSFSSFRNTQRSISKAGQIYQFQEKGSFDLDFNYMSNGDYQSLSHILRNRNSLRDGLIFQPIPYAGDASTILDFTDKGTTNKAYKFSTPSEPMANGPTRSSEFSSSEYDEVKAYDTSAVEIAAAAGNYAGYWMDFNISSFLSTYSYKELRRLTLVIHGMKTSPVRFGIYDVLNSVWVPLVDKYEYNSDLTSSSFYLYRQLVAQAATPWGSNTLYDNFAPSGHVQFLITSANVNVPMALQYARLFINGYWVGEEESGNFENFATAFTGAGRSGQLKLVEL